MTALAVVLHSATVFSQPPATEALIHVLRDGDEGARYQLMAAYVGLPPRSIDDAVIRALSRELNRRTDEAVRVGYLLAKDKPPEDKGEDFEYDVLIIEVLTQQMNPIAIPTLVRVVDQSYPPFEVLVRFGRAATQTNREWIAKFEGFHRYARRTRNR